MTPRGAWPSASILALAALVLPGLTIAQADRPAVELYNPSPSYPTEALGSDIDPEIRVRVLVNDVGKVAEVEVERIRPSSDLDDVFTRAVVDTIQGWRYAPRHEGGKPVATELRWSLTFYGARQEFTRASNREWWSALLGYSPVAPVSLRDLPLDQRKRLLQERADLGAGTLGAARRSVSSARFVVHTDTTQENAEIIANNLEATFSILAEMFGHEIPQRPEELKIQTFVFAEPSSMRALRNGCRPLESSPRGFYSNLGLIAFHLAVPTPEHATEILIHEATHAYQDRHLTRSGVRLPYWLGEGLAEYMANSRIRKGKLIPGRVPASRHIHARFVEARLVITRTTPDARLSMAEVKKTLKSGEGLTLAEMLEADLSSFRGQRLHLYYSMSWLLVHFLRHGEEGWADEAFPEFLLYAVDGFPVTAAIESAYKRPVGDLEEPFRDYVASF